MPNFSKRQWMAALLTVVLTLTVTVSAAGAEDPSDALFTRLRSVYNVVRAWHKDGADLQKFVNGAIQGGLEALGDPHTNYFPPDEYQAFLDSLNGSFSGIGAYLELDGQYVTITAPIKHTPAARAGLQPGDRILEADGTNLVGTSTEKAVQLIRGTPGTEVTLKIERPAEDRTFTVKIKREVISIPEVDSKMLDKEIGYVELSSFGDDSVRDFYAAVDGLKAQGARALVLDLRKNGGGYLDAAVAIGSAFVPEGEAVVWQVGKGGKTPLASTGQTINLPVVVLVDNGSASASEILAGAIQDHGGILVGTKTYGKGTVQQILNLEVGGGIKVTIAEYLTAKERHVHGIGLTPDYVVQNRPPVERTRPLALSRTLRIGMYGDEVKALQERLQDLGYQPDMDGFFGAGTGRAVVGFARDHSLAEDAIINLDFVEELNLRLAAKWKRADGADLQLDKAFELVRSLIK